MDPDVEAQVELLCRRGIQWTRVLEMGTWHRVTPLVYTRLKQICPGAVPRPVLDALGERFRLNAAKNMNTTARLQRFLERLEVEGIPAISFKGPALAVMAYRSLALRVFDDVDLLVARDDLPRTRALLVADGYRPEFVLDERHQAALAEAGRPCAFIDEAARVTVDLHCAVTARDGSPSIDSLCLRDRVEPVTVLGRALPTVSREALLVLLCVHGAKHMWERLLWVCDVAALLGSGGKIPWGAVQALAGEWKCERILALGLTLAATLLHADVPDESRHSVDNRAVGLAARAGTRLLHGAGTPLGGLESMRFHLEAMDRWRDRLHYLRSITKPGEADWATVALPTPFEWLYYPLRVLRLLTRGPERTDFERRTRPD
jgi:hypothetical protein